MHDGADRPGGPGAAAGGLAARPGPDALRVQRPGHVAVGGARLDHLEDALDQRDRRGVDDALGHGLAVAIEHRLAVRADDGLGHEPEGHRTDWLSRFLAPREPVLDAGALTGRVLVVALPGDNGVEQVAERLRVLHRVDRHARLERPQRVLDEMLSRLAVASGEPVRALDDQRAAVALGVGQCAGELVATVALGRPLGSLKCAISPGTFGGPKAWHLRPPSTACRRDTYRFARRTGRPKRERPKAARPRRQPWAAARDRA